ncbi:Vms1/Ankzf1 family peptidyl-tRNA hydrolase [Arthrobacter sp. ISL-28]|uniref:baeRF2 domain-containing protein n=1 Tax=Arthrobacter sp. ISL-28 TaxID=2819108 RepID=UPI001BE78B1B|nr:Vms1/Ankzf1 family peptidyl-tRNA hydrolase [Arthrobacter sp. ISL-28]MBT2523283.1 hypothetical protein [Arthrobacter sp. ISL-28]
MIDHENDLTGYSGLYGKEGPWCTVLADVGTGTVDSLEALDVRPGQIRDALLASGASKDDAAAAEDALRPAEGTGNPAARFLLIRQGRVELDRVLPGQRVDSPHVAVGVIPDLLPLTRHGAMELPVVTASVDRSGADIALSYARRTVEGDDMAEVPGGGWSQGQYQHRTEEVWRKNAEEAAAQIDKLVLAKHPAAIAIGGDERARNLVLSQLSEASQAIAATVDSHTRAGGADPEVMNTVVEKMLAESQAHGQHRLLERLEEEKGHHGRKAAFGLTAVVHALQQAQVDTLVLSQALTADPGAENTATDPDRQPSRELLVLDASPWIAVAEDEALTAGILGKAPAAAALIRAAVLTHAHLEFVPDTAIPSGSDAAVLLRWTPGPDMPGER